MAIHQESVCSPPRDDSVAIESIRTAISVRCFENIARIFRFDVTSKLLLPFSITCGPQSPHVIEKRSNSDAIVSLF